MVIGLDMMGGDFAPEEAVKGVLAYFESFQDKTEIEHLNLIGIPEEINPLLHSLKDYQDFYTLIPCKDTITMNEHPTKALKEKPESSISVGFGLLQQEKIDAFISAGNTGAMMVGALYSVKAIPGILRPTIASPIPKENGKFNFILDVGANADCKPEHLVQFAIMGSLYAQHVLGLNDPRVALLNIGEEPEKGNILTQSTYPLLTQTKEINFVGNKEARDLFSNAADVFVCEGFEGNIVLKLAESIYQTFKARKVEDSFLEQFNYEIYGGTPILGINAPVIIGHGISRAKAFKAMIKTATNIVESGLVNILQQKFKAE